MVSCQIGGRGVKPYDVTPFPLVADTGYLIPGLQVDAIGKRMGDIPLLCEQNIPYAVYEIQVHSFGQMPKDFFTSSTLALARSMQAA